MENITHFYTVNELAYELSISEQTIRKLIRDGKLEAIKVGRTYRIPYESLLKLKTRQTHPR